MSEKSDLHAGHRERMWRKFCEHGISAFNEHEMLEVLLFMMIPQVNTNEIAHEIIKESGSLKNALLAPVSELCKIKGIGEKTAIQISFVGAPHRILTRLGLPRETRLTAQINSRIILSSTLRTKPKKLSPCFCLTSNSRFCTPSI